MGYIIYGSYHHLPAQTWVIALNTWVQALQSKITSQSQRLGVFGSMLGDKAAEVTTIFVQLDFPHDMSDAMVLAKIPVSAHVIVSLRARLPCDAMLKLTPLSAPLAGIGLTSTSIMA